MGFNYSCLPLFDTLRIAHTQQGGEGDLSTACPIVAANEPVPLFRAEAELTLYMDKKVLHRDLKGLVEVPAQIGPTTAALTAAVSTLTDTQLRLTEATER